MEITNEKLIEDYLIVKGILNVLDNPDNLSLERQAHFKKYLDDTKNGNTRVSYMLEIINFL